MSIKSKINSFIDGSHDLLKITAISVAVIVGLIFIIVAGYNVLSLGDSYYGEADDFTEIAMDIGKNITGDSDFDDFFHESDLEYIKEQLVKANKLHTRNLRINAFIGSLPTLLIVVYFLWKEIKNTPYPPQPTQIQRKSQCTPPQPPLPQSLPPRARMIVPSFIDSSPTRLMSSRTSMKK